MCLCSCYLKEYLINVVALGFSMSAMVKNSTHTLVIKSARHLQDKNKKPFKQDIVFKKDKATLHVISKRCEDR